MGERLHTIIKALEQRMDTGVLHELNVTRLHMLIGNELVKRSNDLPDDDAYIELIEKAMQNYFQKDIMNAEDIANEDKEDEIKEDNLKPQNDKKKINLQPQVNFKLNIKKNEDNNQVIINQVPFIFSPIPVRNILTSTIIKSLTNISKNEDTVEDAFHYIEETSFVKSIQLFTEVFHNISKDVSTEQKIRLGLVIYRLLGYGDFIMEKGSSWKITLTYSGLKLQDMDYFSLGFVRGIFVAADVDLYNSLGFAIANTLESSIITGSSL
ncbi:MAG: hypothetical protein OEV78_01330 [Spirochaetia bacterium]|nr:hypothetical protein [Spirochaetia bacterium]